MYTPMFWGIADRDLIPTVIELGAAPQWGLGAVDYPPFVTRRLGFSRTSLALYEGVARFAVPLVRTDGTPTETPPILPITGRLQACSDEVCLAPQSVVLELAWPEVRP